MNLVPHPIRPELGQVTKEEAEKILKQRRELEKQKGNLSPEQVFVEGSGGSIITKEDLTEEELEALREKKKDN